MRGRKCPWWCVFLNRNNTLLLHRHVVIADLIKSKAWHAKIISTRSVSLRFRRRICLLSTGCSWPGKESWWRLVISLPVLRPQFTEANLLQCNFWGVCYNVSDEGLQNLSNVVTWNGSWTTIHQPHLVCWTRMDGEARLSWTIWPMKGSVCKWRQARSRTYLMTESVALRYSDPVHCLLLECFLPSSSSYQFYKTWNFSSKYLYWFEKL